MADGFFGVLSRSNFGDEGDIGFGGVVTARTVFPSVPGGGGSMGSDIVGSDPDTTLPRLLVRIISVPSLDPR